MGDLRFAGAFSPEYVAFKSTSFASQKKSYLDLKRKKFDLDFAAKNDILPRTENANSLTNQVASC